MQDIAAELRWILLASGVALILALAVFGRRRRHAASDHSTPRATTPARQSSLDATQRTSVAPSRRIEEGTKPAVIMMDEYQDRSPSLGDMSDLDLGWEYNEPSFDAPSSGASTSTSINASGGNLNLDVNTSDVADRDDLEDLAQRSYAAARQEELADEAEAIDDEGPIDERVLLSDSAQAALRISESSHDAKTIDLDVEQQAHRSSTRGVVARRVISLRLSFDQKRVSGSLLRQCLNHERMVYGKYDIFHRMGDAGLIMFSVASMVEPGVFDLATMNDTVYPGVTFFMQVPGAHDAISTYDEMLGCARSFEEALDGVLQDEQGIALSPLRAERLREEIINFQHISGAASAVSTARNFHT